LAYIIILLVILEVLVSYFLTPYHPVRHTLERIVEPLLRPIRRVLPLVGGFDFSPLVLIILVSFLSSVLTYILNAIVR
jgi:YggT family protein